MWSKTIQYSATFATLLLLFVIIVLVDAVVEEPQLFNEARSIYDCIDNQINNFPVRIHRHNKDHGRLFYESNHLTETKLALRVNSDLRVHLVPIHSRVAESTVIRDNGKSYKFKEIYMRESGTGWLEISFLFHTEPVDDARLLVLKFLLKDKLASLFPEEVLKPKRKASNHIVTLSSDSVILEMSDLKNYYEYSNTWDDDYESDTQPVCSSIDKINVFSVLSDESSVKKRSKRSDDDSESGTTLHFTSDATFTTNCIIIAIVVTIVSIGLFSLYYFCNRDIMGAIAKKIKFTVMKMFK